MFEESNNKNTNFKLRKIADLIAGMTDRSAIKCHVKYFPDKIEWPKQLYFFKCQGCTGNPKGDYTTFNNVVIMGWGFF